MLRKNRYPKTSSRMKNAPSMQDQYQPASPDAMQVKRHKAKAHHPKISNRSPNNHDLDHGRASYPRLLAPMPTTPAAGGPRCPTPTASNGADAAAAAAAVATAAASHPSSAASAL